MAHEANELIKAPPTAHRRRDVVAAAQYVLPVFAVLGVVGFGVGEWLVRREFRYSPGPLASVHGQWNNQCAACHVSSQPLAAENWLTTIGGDTHVADAKCQTCHAGPEHHKLQRASEVVGCTACHHEHLGTPGKLLAVGDGQCVSCHRDLARHSHPPPVTDEQKREVMAMIPKRDGPIAVVISNDDPRYQDVTGFTANTHPEFAVLRDKKKDPGAIAFNHAKHLVAGMGNDPARPGPFTLSQLSPDDRERYRKPGQTDDAPVVLDCRSCHQTDARDQTAKAKGPVPARGSGAAMAPIDYEQHCQACHPLTIDRQRPGDRKSEFLTIPHREQPEKILGRLQGHYYHLLLEGLWQPPGVAPATLLPGKPAEAKQATKEIDAEAEAATLKLLLEHHDKTLEQKVLGQTTCQKCHPSLDPAKGIKQTVPAANVPAVWFEHARFDHTAHRAVDCRECHAQATTSTTSQDVMLPGIAVCIKCHAPARGSGPTATGGARFDCIGCHTYHHGDAPLHGRGSKARQPAQGLKTVTEFIQGK